MANPVILLHGALGSASQFESLIPFLVKSYNIYSINFSGHGKNQTEQLFSIQLFADDVTKFMNRHKIECADVFGFSMGGYTGLWLCRNFPHRIGKLITLGTKLNWNKEISEKEVSLCNSDKIEEKVPAFADLLKLRHGNNWETVVSKTKTFLTGLGLNHLTDKDFVQIHNPVLLMLGDRDNMVTPDETYYTAALMSNATVKILPSTPHPLEKINALLIATEIFSFLNK